MPDKEAWVVRKTVIEVTTFPRYLEPLALATWCSGTGSHWAERRISMTGERGGAIEAATTWVHVDLDSGRPTPVPAGFEAIYGEAHQGRRVKARLDHPSTVPADVDGFPWPLRFSDFDVLDHVNNAAYWQIVEEALSVRRDLRAPLVAEVQHRQATERGAEVQVSVVEDAGALQLWVTADDALTATARVEPL